jgi:LacI family transcriptional regulator
MAIHPSHRVTIIDVARQANVSAGTVSNALTGKRPVAEDTRTRIMQAIRDLGYQPNLLARGLVNQRSQTVGIVASGLDYYGPSRTLIGIDQEANALGYALLLDLLHSPMEANVDGVLNVLSARRVDGIIWAVHEISNNRAWVAAERLSRLPPIVFLTMKPQIGATVVNSDNHLGASMATQHLLDLGRRHIGLISGPNQWWEARERQRGWRDCLVAAGRVASDDLTYPGDWRAGSGEAGLITLIETHPELDALFVANDEMALGVLRAAHRLGKRIPEDLAVVGYDNMPEVPYFWPALTTVRPRLLDMGKLAIQTLHTIVEARRNGQEMVAPEVQTLSPELVVRESTMGLLAERVPA